MSDAADRIVQKLWSYCHVLRDDGLSYQDYLEQHYRETLRVLGQQGGMLGLIFEKAQNKIQDPAKLRQLVVERSGKRPTLPARSAVPPAGRTTLAEPPFDAVSSTTS